MCYSSAIIIRLVLIIQPFCDNFLSLSYINLGNFKSTIYLEFHSIRLFYTHPNISKKNLKFKPYMFAQYRDVQVANIFVEGVQLDQKKRTSLCDYDIFMRLEPHVQTNFINFSSSQQTLVL
jgi:hypothetical protein